MLTHVWHDRDSMRWWKNWPDAVLCQQNGNRMKVERMQELSRRCLLSCTIVWTTVDLTQNIWIFCWWQMALNLILIKRLWEDLAWMDAFCSFYKEWTSLQFFSYCKSWYSKSRIAWFEASVRPQPSSTLYNVDSTGNVLQPSAKHCSTMHCPKMHWAIALQGAELIVETRQRHMGWVSPQPSITICKDDWSKNYDEDGWGMGDTSKRR